MIIEPTDPDTEYTRDPLSSPTTPPPTLSTADRFADMMRGLMGSWPFVIGFLIFMGVWMLTNGFGIDKAPYGGLNLALSALAGIQASLIMIATKRLDDMAAAQTKHMLEVDEEADSLIKEVFTLQKEIHELTKQIHAIVHKP